LSKISSTVACETGLRALEPEKITSVSESPRRRLAELSPMTQRTVDDVRLAAAIGPHHAGHVGRQVQGGRIDERLEAGQLDRGKTHRGSGLGPASGLRLPSKSLILLGSMPVERV
jgi:hypothetical protein